MNSDIDAVLTHGTWKCTHNIQNGLLGFVVANHAVANKKFEQIQKSALNIHVGPRLLKQFHQTQ